MNFPQAEVLDTTVAAALLPERDPRGHKGTFGRVVVVAGSLDYAGAALMSGAAALRAGSGLVTLCVPASLQPAIAGRVPELITRALPETGPYEVDADESAAGISDMPADALLVGPGLKPGRGSTRLVSRLLGTEGVAAVVDAGALDALWGCPAGGSGGVARSSSRPIRANSHASDSRPAPATRNAAPEPSRLPPRGVSWSCSRVPAPSSPDPTAACCVRPSRSLRWGRVAPATCWPGS